MDDIKKAKPVRARVAQPTRRSFSMPSDSMRAARSTQQSSVTQHLSSKMPRSKTTIRLNLSLKFPTSLGKNINKTCMFMRKHMLMARLGWGLLAILMLTTVFTETIKNRHTEVSYHLSAQAQSLVGLPNDTLAQSLVFDSQAGVYDYNKGYQAGLGVSGQQGGPKFIASFNAQPEKGSTVTDPVSQTSVTFRPEFEMERPIQDKNRLIYPLKANNAQKVYTLKGNGFKEDIILNKASSDTLEFKYKLVLDEGTEARMESDGSLGIYGVTQTLLGSVSTASTKDQELLSKARQNGEKNNLLFTFPAPFVREAGKKTSNAKAWFSLKGNELIVHANKLKQASYPLSIDPSVYVETASKLMRGNNESNLDFDVTNDLIQKGKLTGARFDAWTSSLALPSTLWNFGSAVAGGYAYVVGGTIGSTNQTTVYWSKLDTSTNAITAPNPGNGVCASWCTDSAYSLPAARGGLSLVAYNGYLFAIGGKDSTCVGAANACTTAYKAQLGANGEPISWTATSSLTVGRAFFGAVAYNNRIYAVGGMSNTNSGGDTSVEFANINPDGSLGTWSTAGMTAIPTAGRWGHSVQQYNGYIYLIGGSNATTLAATVQFIKINSDGTLASSWITTTPFVTARISEGGNFSAIWGGYLYVAGGCTAINASGYCTAAGITGGNTIQLASINADGSLTNWSDIIGITSARIGYGFQAWRNTLYGIGGCTAQDTTTGSCTTATSVTQYGVINQDGDASTVNNSQSYSAGAVGGNPCSGFAGGSSSLNTCNLPPAGSAAGQGGQMSSGVVVNNGYIYIIGGCTDVSQTNECTTSSGAGAMSGNVSYAAIASDGTIVAPAACSGTWYGTWCVDSTNTVPFGYYSTGTASQTTSTVTGTGTVWTTAMVGMVVVFANGVRATITARNSNTSLTVNVSQSVASQNYVIVSVGEGTMAFGVFNNNIYVYGGTAGNSTNWSSTVSYVGLNTDGSLSGSWMSLAASTTGVSTAGRGYSYMFTRANPASAGTNPGNIYILGGCTGGAAGVGCSTYYTETYKCNISTTGSVSGCTTTGQLQVDSDPGTAGNQGLGLMAGTMYANYIYLVGGSSATTAQRGDVIYAKIDDTNNIVAVSGGIWTVAAYQMNPVRRRGFAFGYNGYLYALAGYNGTASLNDLLYAKINVSDGSISAFNTSTVTVTTRWDLRAVVANGYVYAVGGCSTGAPPNACTAMTASVQTFQLYNNYSGSPAAYSVTGTTGTGISSSGTGVDRIGGSTTILNGYIYYVGGCTVITCGANLSASTYYAPLNADGSIGTWAAGGNLIAARAWGKLVAVGGTLYYLGGYDVSGNSTTTVYYTTSISTGSPSWAGTTATNSLPVAGAEIGAAVWNNRIYVTGGHIAGVRQTTIQYSPDLSAGGDITSAWTTNATGLNVARSGHTTIAYANNLYVLGGFDGTNYLNDVQFAQINTNGSVGAFSYSTSLPQRVYEADGFAANGYMYLFGGRSATSTCTTNTYIAPISANTTIASGNSPTGMGDWSQTNVKFTGARYGVAAAYNGGKTYLLGGGCAAYVSSTDRAYYSTLQSQPQIAQYSLMIDTNTDVFPTKWLMNGLDNSIGARWIMNYRSSTNAANTWGQTTSYGTVTLGTPAIYTARDAGGGNTNFARYYYMFVSIDSSQAFGYPEDVTRGPTIADLSLFFTSDPSKRLIHGKTFTGGLQQPLDTPFP